MDIMHITLYNPYKIVWNEYLSLGCDHLNNLFFQLILPPFSMSALAIFKRLPYQNFVGPSHRVEKMNLYILFSWLNWILFPTSFMISFKCSTLPSFHQKSLKNQIECAWKFCQLLGKWLILSAPSSTRLRWHHLSRFLSLFLFAFACENVRACVSIDMMQHMLEWLCVRKWGE